MMHGFKKNDGILRRIFKTSPSGQYKNISYFMAKFIPVLLLLLMVGAGGVLVEAQAAGKIVGPTMSVAPTETVVPTVLPTPVFPQPHDQLTEKDVPRLEKVLETQQVGSWNIFNSFRKLVRLAVANGVRADTIVLLLLLPLIATLVAGMHYLLGLTGYGIFTPTMIAVALLATGIFGGLALFAMILIISLVANLGLSKLRLHFWPARSINLLFISLGTFGLMIGSSYIKLVDLTQLSIFPVLFMIMLAEDFVRTQLIKSKNEAKRLMIGTLVLSIIGALVTSIRQVQEMVLLYPEGVILLTIVINVLIGNYTGIRLSELGRFKKALRE